MCAHAFCALVSATRQAMQHVLLGERRKAMRKSYVLARLAIKTLHKVAALLPYAHSNIISLW